MEFCQLGVSRLENLFLLSGPSITNINEYSSEGEIQSNVWKNSVLMQGVVDESLLFISFRIAKLPPHNGKSDSYFSSEL